MNEYDSFAQSSDEGLIALLAGGLILNLVVFLLIVVPIILGMWKMFAKAGKPGWAAIVPIYNYLVMLEMIGKPAWWIILMIIPCVSTVFSFIVYIELAKRFGKDTLFGVLMVFLPMIMFPLLGFGDAQYTPPQVTDYSTAQDASQM